MNDSEIEEEPREAVQAQIVAKAERIMSLRKEATEKLRSLWTAGEIDRLPCHDECDGEIVVAVGGIRYRGFCPAYMEKEICPLTTKAARELKARMERAGFGVRYHDPEPGRIRPLETIDDYLSNLTTNMAQGRGLLMSGGVGVGKTMALGYIAKKLLVVGRGVWCVLMEELIRGLTERDTRRAMVTRALGVEVLMLDDFGSGEMPPWILGIVEGIVEKRYANKRPTLVTTNLTREQLKAEPAFRRMIDRWRETSTFVNIGGESQRGE